MVKVNYYCINLASADIRKARIQAQANLASIEIRFIDAVEGTSLDIEKVAFYDRQVRRRYLKDMEPNEIACSLSHRLALEAFLADACDFGVVLEDDAIFKPSIGADVERILKRVTGFDAIKLESRDNRGIKIGGGSLNCFYP